MKHFPSISLCFNFGRPKLSAEGGPSAYINAVSPQKNPLFSHKLSLIVKKYCPALVTFDLKFLCRSEKAILLSQTYHIYLPCKPKTHGDGFAFSARQDVQQEKEPTEQWALPPAQPGLSCREQAALQAPFNLLLPWLYLASLPPSTCLGGRKSQKPL